MARAKNSICLWYDKDAEEAAHFYAETFGAEASRAFEAMLEMSKIDVAKIEEAVEAARGG